METTSRSFSRSFRRAADAKKGSRRGAPAPFFTSLRQQPSVRAPERCQRFAIRALAQLLERTVADLADAFARHAEQRADLLQRTLFTIIETVVEVQDLALAFRQILLEHPIEKLALCLRLNGLFDVFCFCSGKALAERCT